MFVDDVSTSSRHRLNQILHTLKHVHSFDLKLDESSVDEITTIHNTSEVLKTSIVQEGSFNNWHTDPNYAKHMLIVEATRLYLKEIAPRRRPRRLHEGVDSETDSDAAKVGYWLIDFAEKSSTENDKLLKILNSFSRIGEELIDVGEHGRYKSLTDLIDSYEARANDAMNTPEDRKNAELDIHALRVGLKLYNKHNNSDNTDTEEMSEMHSEPTGNTVDTDFAARFPELVAMAKKYGIANGSEEMTDEGNEFTGALAAAKSAHKDTFKVGNKQYTVNETTNKRIVENHMQDHNYQASMARSELYRNAKYAMDMLKMIRPEDDVEPWIAAALTKDAMYLDKIYHYLDYYTKFEPDQLPGSNTLPDMAALDEEEDELGEGTGEIARSNLVQIFEYSVKLFHMIQPGDKLEGWVAMKLTTASEGISSAKHYLDYKNFERHASEHFSLAESRKYGLREAEARKDFKLVADLIKRHSDAGARHHMAKHHADVFSKMDSKFNRGMFFTAANAKDPRRTVKEDIAPSAEQDLQQAETLIAAKSISNDLQAMAEKVARMGVDELMPLVDTMKTQFGPEAADAYNQVMKDQLDALLTATQAAKDQSDDAVIALQGGGIPGAGTTDIENAPAIPGEEPELEAPEGEESDGLGTMPAAAGGEEPLGRAKKPAPGELPAELAETRRRKLGEKWDTEMKTAEKDKGKWDGWTLAKLRSRRKSLMDKETRTAAEQKEVKQIDFAIRAKQKDKFGDVKKESVSEAKQLNSAAALAREIINSIVNDYKNQGFNWVFADVGEFGDFLADEYDRTTRDADGDNSYQDRFFELSDSDMNKVMNAVKRGVNKVFNNQSDLDDRGLGRNSFRLTSESVREAKKAKPDFLDVDKDGNKKESMKKAVADKANAKKVDEAKKSKPDFLDLDKDGNKKEPMKKAVADKAKGNATAKKKVNESKKGQPTVSDSDIKRHYKGPEGWIYQPLTSTGSTYLSRGTRWDLAEPRYFDMYNKRGPIYIIHDTDTNDRYAYHPSTDTFASSNDRPANIPDWVKDKIGSMSSSSELAESKNSKNPYAIGMWQAKKEAGLDPNKPAKNLPKKLITRGHRIARGIDKTDESIARIGSLVEKAVKGKRQLENKLAEHRAMFARMVNEGTISDVLVNGQGLEGDILQKRIFEMQTMISGLENQIAALNANSRRQMKEAIEQERKAYRFAQVKAASPWGVMVESASGRDYKFFADQQARDYWIQLNSNVKANLIGPSHFDKASSN